MAYRSGGSRVAEFEERESFYRDGPPRRGPPPTRDEVEIYERREESRGPPPIRRGPPPGREEVEFYERREESRGPPPGVRRGPPPPREDIEFYERREERREQSRGPPVRAPVKEYEDIDIRIREREQDGTPAFLREDARRVEAGPLVLRQREIETVDRRRPRSPSPVRVREQRIVRARSLTPPPPPAAERVRTRIVERERERSPAPPPPMERVRTRFIERERERSPSPPSIDIERSRTRIIERERARSPTPPPMERERIHTRIVQRERSPSPSPSPPPPPPLPQVIRGPTIEREVITHYRDIDHGVERVHKVPSPPPPPAPRPARTRESETDIDIYTSRNKTEVDIHKSRTRSRSRSRGPPRHARSFYDEEVHVHSTDRNRDHLHVTDTTVARRRSASAAPRPDYAEEAEYITSKIDSRGRMGEAWGGATKDWTIVDVPPGTERVKMDGVGGGGAEVTWQRYNGVRRAKFIPERDGALVSTTSSSTTVSEPVRDRDRLSVQIYDSKAREPSRERIRESDVEVEDTRIVVRDRERDLGVGPPARRPRSSEMWTEITKDLVVREAIEELGYEYEETEYFFYVMQYLRYEDVLELVNRSDHIRRARRERAREIEWEREYRDSWERRDRRHKHRHSLTWDKYDDERERITEREILYERAPRYMR